MQIVNIIRYAGLLAAIGFAIPLAGCGGGGGGGSDTAALHGMLRVALTNTHASACAYEEVNISVDAVRANPSASAGPSDGNWQPKEVTLVQSKKVDLMKLTSNSSQDLVTISLPAGHYAQVRLWLEQTSVLVVMPNSVVRSGTKAALDISNAASIGIPHEFNIPANGQVDLTLDIDTCASVIDTGNGTFQFAPALTATST